MMTRRAMFFLITLTTLNCGDGTRIGSDRDDIGGGSALFNNPAVASDGRLAYA